MKWPVILASASPRRVELLSGIVPDFQVIPAHLDEDLHTHEDPHKTARDLAREKAFAVFEKHPEALVIGGDTVVAIEVPGGYEQLAKPTDEEDAMRILRRLSGRGHLVITGVCIRWPEGLHLFTEDSKVVFRSMTDEEIHEYVATGEPMDKAGAYGIQGGATRFATRIEGSYTNVMGLPVEALKAALQEIH